LLADEILNAPAPKALRWIGIPIELYRMWDGVSLPSKFMVVNPGFAQPYHATPDKIAADTKFVRVQIEYDFTADFRSFVDEVRRLKALHGEVRFLFGFS
jgi:hypothetical protein